MAPARLAARITIIPLALALVFVILHGAFGVGRDTTPKTHSLRNPSACKSCHVSETDSQLTGTEPELCYGCHADSREHGKNLLVDPETRCTSCHDPHRKVSAPYMLLPEATGR